MKPCPYCIPGIDNCTHKIMDDSQVQDMTTPEAREMYYKSAWETAATAGNEARQKCRDLADALEALRPCAHYCSDGNCPHGRRWKSVVSPLLLSVEAAASVALNKGTPPDYAVPAPVATSKLACYLCGQYFDSVKRINWRGHWICPGCLDKEKVSPDVHSKFAESSDDRSDTSPLLRETTAHAILHKAISTITQRGKDYNKPGGERSMKATVEAFNAITGHSLTVVEGWQFMEVLKMVRAQHSPHRIDNFLDGCAYAALAGEEALNSQNK